MAEPERTSAQLIVEEIRRQVDLQVSAHDALDTKAMAVFGGAVAVAALIAPRVVVGDLWQNLSALGTFGLLVAAMVCLLLAVRPRVRGFSNGPDVDQLAERIDDPTASLDAELVPAFVKVRNVNADVLNSKGGWMVNGLRLLFGAVLGVAAMVVVGAIK